MLQIAESFEKRCWICLLPWLLSSLAVQADENDKPLFTFASYGTLALTHSSEQRADFSSSLL
ncbi:hypothetical protein, partial [Chitinimonas sp.]|uniref:hypothetical protein n=1 Tax=Chitinimonas sp. TaxID=1934313 RepID=UPI0035B10AED